MTDFLLLTKEEVRKAFEHERCGRFFTDEANGCQYILQSPDDVECTFCKVLTEFASQGDPVGKGEEDE